MAVVTSFCSFFAFAAAKTLGKGQIHMRAASATGNPGPAIPKPTTACPGRPKVRPRRSFERPLCDTPARVFKDLRNLCLNKGA